MEPEWSKQIPSETICNFFYAFFVIYAVFFGLAVLGLGMTLFSMKKMGAVALPLAIQAFLVTGLAATMMLFYYLICDRALLATRSQSQQRA